MSRAAVYQRLLTRLRTQVLIKTHDPTAILSNVAATLYHALMATPPASAVTASASATAGASKPTAESVNWCGFYIVRSVVYTDTPDVVSEKQMLVLGPFHGQPAVTLIHPGRGVCGTCLVERKTQLVPNVHEHPNHIACDSRSQSEVVVPVFADAEKTKLVALIDIDSPLLNGFSEEDRDGLEAIAALVGVFVHWQYITPVILERAVVENDDVTCTLGAH